MYQIHSKDLCQRAITTNTRMFPHCPGIPLSSCLFQFSILLFIIFAILLTAGIRSVGLKDVVSKEAPWSTYYGIKADFNGFILVLYA